MSLFFKSKGFEAVKDRQKQDKQRHIVHHSRRWGSIQLWMLSVCHLLLPMK